MVSPKQLAANRRNAQLASGPRTEQGKRRSAVNATRHGLTAPILSSPWGNFLPALQALLQADGDCLPHQAQALALRVLEYERNLQHLRNRYLKAQAKQALAVPTVSAPTAQGAEPADPFETSGQKEHALAMALAANYPARGKTWEGLSRKTMQSIAAWLEKAATRKQRNAEAELRNADRHLRHAANQLVKQCKSLGQAGASTG